MTFRFERPPAGLLLLLLALLVILLSLNCCRPTRERCYTLYPPEVGQKDSSWVSYQDSLLRQRADSSQSMYLIDCQEENGIYKARIISLLKNSSGQYVRAPQATIIHDTLFTTAVKPEVITTIQIKSFHYKAVTSKVYVKITNILLWWQNFFMVIGMIATGAGVCYGIYLAISSSKWWLVLLKFGISKISGLFKKGN